MWAEFINNRERVPEGIKLLREKDNLFLFGNGVYAEDLYMRLEQWRVKIDGVIVSDEYYRDGMIFHGLKVIPFGKIRAQQIDIIAGYDILKHEELNKILVNSKIVKGIYYLEGAAVFMNSMRLREDIVVLDDYYKILLNRELDYQYFQENYDKFIWTYNCLADEKSKRTMECYLRGHIEVKGWPMLPVWEESDVDKQYFPDSIVQLSQHEVFVDCGAFTGDTLEMFSRQVDTFDKYYALEPDTMVIEQLESIIKKVCMKGKVVHLAIGVSNKKGNVYFSHSSSGCGQVRYDGGIIGDRANIELDSIDDLLSKREKVTFIKMDIEGEEMLALQGAEHIIKRDKPQLAICVYHKREDLITIPQYIKELVPEYQLYLRAHWPNASEVVLYCIINK